MAVLFLLMISPYPSLAKENVEIENEKDMTKVLFVEVIDTSVDNLQFELPRVVASPPNPDGIMAIDRVNKIVEINSNFRDVNSNKIEFNPIGDSIASYKVVYAGNRDFGYTVNTIIHRYPVDIYQFEEVLTPNNLSTVTRIWRYRTYEKLLISINNVDNFGSVYFLVSGDIIKNQTFKLDTGQQYRIELAKKDIDLNKLIKFNERYTNVNKHMVIGGNLLFINHGYYRIKYKEGGVWK